MGFESLFHGKLKINVDSSYFVRTVFLRNFTVCDTKFNESTDEKKSQKHKLMFRVLLF